MRQLRTVLPYFRPYRKAMLWGLVLVILANGFGLANPYLLKLPIDALTAEAGADPDTTRRTVLNYALLIVAIALLGNAARYGMREILNSVSRRIEVDLRNDFLRHLLRLDAGFYGRTRTGDLMSLATNDTLAVRQAAGPAVMYSANTIVNFVLGSGRDDLDQSQPDAGRARPHDASAPHRPLVRPHHPHPFRAHPGAVRGALDDGAGEPHRRADRAGVCAGGRAGTRVRRLQPSST